MSIKEHIMGEVEFQYYRSGNLIYKTSTGLEFPVPISDCNEATFPAREKGIFFMRWIRRFLNERKPEHDLNNHEPVTREAKGEDF